MKTAAQIAAEVKAAAAAAGAVQHATTTATASTIANQVQSSATAASTVQKAQEAAKPKKPKYRPKRTHFHPEAEKVARQVIKRGTEQDASPDDLLKAADRVTTRLGWSDPKAPNESVTGKGTVQTPGHKLARQTAEIVKSYTQGSKVAEGVQGSARLAQKQARGPQNTEDTRRRLAANDPTQKPPVQKAPPKQRRLVRKRLEKAVRKAGPDLSGYGKLGPAAKGIAKGAVEGGKEFGVDPSLIMGIAENETGFGAAAGSGTAGAGAVSSAGAQGYMQFMPASRDTVLKATGYDAFSKNPVEAAKAAAGYFKVFAPDAKSDYDRAYSYNHAGWYADDVTSDARKYKALDHASGEEVPKKLKVKARQTLGPTTTKAIVHDIDLSPAKKLSDPAQRRAVKELLVGQDPKGAEKVLGPAATKALLKGGQIVKAPKTSKDGLLKGRYDGSKAMVQEIVGTKVRGDHIGTKNGEAVGVHDSEGDHDRPDGYAQDINGDNPSEHEPPFTQATMDKIVANLRKMGADIPDQTIGGAGWTGDVGGYTVFIEGGVTDHIHVGAHPSDSGGETPVIGPKIKGTDLMVVPKPETSTAGSTATAPSSGISSGTLTGATSGPQTGAKGKNGRRVRRRRSRPLAPSQQTSSGSYLTVGADTETDPYIERLIALTE